jgi:uncharacterized membrane protein
MKELPLLECAGILSPEKSGEIRTYYDANTRSGLHWAVVAFAALGSLLIGSGIILLFAHNWDALSRPARAVLSACPLALAAALSFAALLKNGGAAWREAAGLFHALAVGASVALIGQTYHVSSDLPSFLLTWALLVLPLAFLLRSTGAYLIYLALACGWSGAAQSSYGQAAAFWLLLLPAALRLAHLARASRDSVETVISLAGMLAALCVSTGLAFERTVPGLWIVAYSALLSGAGLLGLCLYGERDGWNNLPKAFGVAGMTVLAYCFTWTSMWHEIGWEHLRHGGQHRLWGVWMDGGITLAFLAGWALAAVKAFRRDSFEAATLAAFPLLATLCFALGSLAPKADTLNALIFNVFVLYLGIMYIALGCRNTKLRQLNSGMAIVSLLLVTRFLDTDFNYLARGLVFIGLGTVFLTVNLFMARRKRQKELAA